MLLVSFQKDALRRARRPWAKGQQKGGNFAFLLKRKKTILTYFLHNQLQFRRMSFFPSRSNIMAATSKARACPQIFREAALTFQLFVKYHCTPPTSSTRTEAVPSRALYHQDEVICEGADTTARLQGQLPWALAAAPAAITFPSVSSDCLISQKNRAVCAVRGGEKGNKNPLQKQSTPLPLQVSPWGEEEGMRESESKRMNHM